MKTFDELFAELLDRAAQRPEGSATVAARERARHGGASGFAPSRMGEPLVAERWTSRVR